MISKKLKRAIKLSPHRNYKIARAVGVHPSTLSQILCGIVRVKNGDERVIRIGKILGLKPSECFEEEWVGVGAHPGKGRFKIGKEEK